MSKEKEKIINKEIAGRVQGDQFDFLLNYQLDDIGDNLQTKIGKTIRVYKFRQVSGYTIFTKNGEIPKFQSINQVEQFANFKTGKEPITIVWEGSSTLSNSIEEVNVNRYEFKVGEYQTCYSIGEYENNIETTEKEIFGANFIVDLKDTNIKLISYDWIPNNEDQINYFYIIVDKRYPSFQLLQLKNYQLNYNETSEKFYSSELEFENINLKYSSTGRQVLDFVQFGAIGFGYAFPKEIENENGEIEIILDENKLIHNGVNSIQLDTNNTTGLISIQIYGSSIVNDNIILQSQPLFLLDSLLPEESNLFYNDQQMNYYYVNEGKPKYKTYIEDYTKNPSNPLTNLGSYNVGSEKKFLGGIFGNKSDIELSNAIDPETNKHINSINSNENWIKVKGKYNVGDYINVMESLDATFPIPMKTTDFLNFNGYVNFFTNQFSFEYEEIIKFEATKTFGILGSLLKLVMGGLDLGWTKDRTLKISQPLNFIVATSTYDMGTALIPATQGEQAIPLELFSDSKEQSIFPIDNKQLCSFHFSLTDYIKDSINVVEGAPIGKGGDGIWNTKYLGQSKDEDFKPLFRNEPTKIFKFNPKSTIAIPNPFNKNQKYIIDTIDVKQIYSGDFRITAFTKDIDIFTQEIYNRSVYSSILSTTSKVSNKFRLISNFIKFNYWNEFNTIGQSPNTWPELLPPPSPTPPPEDFIWIDSIKPQPLFKTQSIPPLTKIINQGSFVDGTKSYELPLFSFEGNFKYKTKIEVYNKNPLYIYTPKLIGEPENFIFKSLISEEGALYERNYLDGNIIFELDKYNQETLSRFDRMAINFINDFGNEVWVKIPNINFISLKNEEGYGRLESVKTNKVFQKITPFKTNGIGISRVENKYIPISTTIINEYTGSIISEGNIRTYFQDFYEYFDFVVENKEGQIQLKFESIFDIKISYFEKDNTLLKNLQGYNIVRNIGIDNNGSNSDFIVKDYSTNNSQIRILRVLLFEKDFDESDFITYVN